MLLQLWGPIPLQIDSEAEIQAFLVHQEVVAHLCLAGRDVPARADGAVTPVHHRQHPGLARHGTGRSP